MSSVETWYVLREGVSVGPLSRSTVESMIRSGEIRPDTMVWPGSGDWIAAGTSSLSPGFAPAPPPAPPAPYPPAPPPAAGFGPPLPSPAMTARKTHPIRNALLIIGAAVALLIALNWTDFKAGFMEGY